MNVLSLFNGMSCGFMALEKLRIKVDNYFVSEIDKYANQAAAIVNPDSVFLGDVTKVSYKNGVLYSENGQQQTKIDFIFAGSPCQGFSFAGKQLNFDDERSKLFFDFVRILEEVRKENPDVLFLLENVRMSKESERVISHTVNVEPIKINSKLLSAQSRPRLYWCNFGPIYQTTFFGPPTNLIPQPKDKKIFLKDVLEETVNEKYFLSEKLIESLSKTNENHGFKFEPTLGEKKAKCITARCFKSGKDDNYIKAKKIELKQPITGPFLLKEERTEEGKKLRSEMSKKTGKDTTPRNGKNKQYTNRTDNKSNTLTASTSMFNTLFIPEATTAGFATINPGECFDLTQPNSKTRRGRRMADKCNTSTTQKPEFYNYDGFKIRRLTPRECMRLQTVPEKYIDKLLNGGISDTQLYKMTGNGWTVDVIAYLLTFAKLTD